MWRRTTDNPPRTLVFTDLDGTLLDHRSYAFGPAVPVLGELRARGIPVVLCTSKTRAEVEAIRARMGNADPFIVENGGAVFLPADYFEFPPARAVRNGAYDRILLGTPRETLVAALRRVRDETGIRIRSFADMTAPEASEATGLAVEQAELALQREFDEPFLVPGGDPGAAARVRTAIAALGFHTARGGRFLHIMGDNDKGLAVRILIEQYRRNWGPLRVVALGDSPNDLPMLDAADVAVLVARPDGSHDPELLRALPRAREAGPGPEGWAEAVRALLE